ncbi:Fizzy-related protein [Orchesella cincta]|uniref:Fizzy-related protein n=1 Tax=Orchesella cincta TaxID=48709 RepID=A0A1D2M6F4_ORCCI|nr:Fizzy-related protein [Orchesella cincta]
MHQLSRSLEILPTALLTEDLIDCVRMNTSTLSTTPQNVKSPSKPRYGDRFMPARVGNSWHVTYPESPDKKVVKDEVDIDSDDDTAKPSSNTEVLDEQCSTYSCLLKNEVLGYDFDSSTVLDSPKKSSCRKLFHYNTTERPIKNTNNGEAFSPYSPSPVSSSSQKLLRTPVNKRRRIPKTPYKVLDAPDLADDFYLNLLDWSSQDVVGIGLGTHVYMWSAVNSEVTSLVDMQEFRDRPTSIKWNEKLHDQRVPVLDWSGNNIFSGSKDRCVKVMDVRAPECGAVHSYSGHKQEVCGLKWSSFNSSLASGGNDNAVMLCRLSWSPHSRHVLASGGGTQDRCIKFWNTITGSCVASIDTNSQVCNIEWSPYSNEIVSTHGYAHNHVAIWKYPSLKLVAKLKGHTQRVLYMALAPDGKRYALEPVTKRYRFGQFFRKSPCRVKKLSWTGAYGMGSEDFKLWTKLSSLNISGARTSLNETLEGSIMK